ncbi:MAG: hypothetical protein QOD63_1213, partial [Actinomycetota bacterium]|nr:hypothetical protein [Actinomycetota bacterium]
MCPSAPAFPSISCTIREVPLPNGAVRRHHVDVFGRVRQEDRADGTWVRFAYDGEGHVRSVEHSSGERVDYEVDGAGRTWRARRGSQETTIRLEGDGLPVEVAQQSGEHRLALRYRRDRQGRAVAWGYPDGNDWLV